MKRGTLSVCLVVLVAVISVTLTISVTAQELDEFLYLPVIIHLRERESQLLMILTFQDKL